jgi:hypothetical protein
MLSHRNVDVSMLSLSRSLSRMLRAGATTVSGASTELAMTFGRQLNERPVQLSGVWANAGSGPDVTKHRNRYCLGITPQAMRPFPPPLSGVSL